MENNEGNAKQMKEWTVCLFESNEKIVIIAEFMDRETIGTSFYVNDGSVKGRALVAFFPAGSLKYTHKFDNVKKL